MRNLISNISNLSIVNKILFALVVILSVILVGILYLQKGIFFEEPYYAVYLNTGDLYFGKINWFPRFSLSDAYLLQKTNDQQNPFTIVKFDNAFWNPEGNLYLNYDNVIWKAKLKNTSQVVNYIKSMPLKSEGGANIKQPLQQPQLQSFNSNLNPNSNPPIPNR